MMELEEIIKTMENKIESDDFEVVMTDCMETVESDYNELSSVEPLLQMIERHPLTSFGSPGPIVHFVETFYKKGYEEKLISSLKKNAYCPYCLDVTSYHQRNGTSGALFEHAQANFRKWKLS